MIRKSVWILLTFAVAELWGAASASGQGIRSEIYSRPTERSPSALMGGRFTRARNLDPIQPSRSTSLIGQPSLSFSGTRRQSRYATTLDVARGGLMSSYGTSSATDPLLHHSGLNSSSIIRGVEDAVSLDRGIPGVSRMYVPSPMAYEFTPHPGSTRFTNYFGLEPTLPPAEDAPVAKLAQRVEAIVDQRIEQARERGLELFREATFEPRDPRTGQYPSCVDCEDKLRRAVQQLTMVDELDNDAYLAPLIMAHAALEQERPMYATNKLIDAWKRNPDLLSNRDEMAEYFGDAIDGADQSAYMETQMRRYLRTGDLNPSSPTAHALAAYCAWRLGDPIRLNQSAQRAVETLADAATETPDLLNFVVALQNSGS